MLSEYKAITMKDKHSLFEKAPNIVPPALSGGMSITEIVTAMGQTSFEARKFYRGAQLYRRMIDDGDTIWLGIAGAGIAGGMGGMVISLLENGFIDVICSTGAQGFNRNLTSAEIMVSIVCLEFAYTQAPRKMKSPKPRYCLKNSRISV